MITIRQTQPSGRRGYEPTLNDIQRVRKDIQATWSPQERVKRTRGPRAAWWLPPISRLSTLVEAAI